MGGVNLKYKVTTRFISKLEIYYALFKHKVFYSLIFTCEFLIPLCYFIFVLITNMLGKKESSKFEEITYNVLPCVLLVSVKVNCVCELTGAMCVGLRPISRKALLNCSI
jgi:hypothetical protein